MPHERQGISLPDNVASDKFSTGNLHLAELFSNAALCPGGVRVHAASSSRSGSRSSIKLATIISRRLSIFVEANRPSARHS
jgi:hypothetical protein